MVVTLQQLLAECTAIFPVCIVEHCQPPCAAILHKTLTGQQWNGFQNNAHIQDQRSICWQHTKHSDLSQ